MAKFLKQFMEAGLLSRKPGSGRPLSISSQVKTIFEAKMREDDKTTAYQLRDLLLSHGYNISSRRTVLHCRFQLGWTFQGSAYCQLIRYVNKGKRLEWACEHLHDNFDNVVWTDKCSVQLESHKRFCCRKQGEPPRLKPRWVINNTKRHIDKNIKMVFCRAKHPVKVHVWAGIFYDPYCIVLLYYMIFFHCKFPASPKHFLKIISMTYCI